MNEKLQELTRKIYDEGLEKGKQEAQEIIAKAKKEAEDILAKAEKEAAEKLLKAEKEAAELRKNVHSELAMASRQALSTVKQKVSMLLNQQAIEHALGNSFEDKDFIKSLISSIVENWGEITKSGQGVIAFLPAKEKDQLEAFLNKQMAGSIGQGLDIEFEEGIKSGFRIGPRDQGFKIGFTEKDFENFFMQFLRSRTQKFFTESN